MASIRSLLFIVSMTLLLAVCLPGATLTGDWTGTLNAGPASLRLVLHVTENADGAPSATLDSPDQGATGLQIDSIALDVNQVRFTMSRLAATFEGTLAEDGKSIEGTWRQGPNSFPLTFRRAVDTAATKPVGTFDDPALARLKGIWAGTLSVGPQSLRLVVRVEEQDGEYRVSFESPDQSSVRIPVSSISVADSSVEFAIPAIGGSYKGQLDEAGAAIQGTWSQGGQSAPLKLEKTEAAPEARRPQNPQPPFPYRAVDVTFPGGADGVTLAGTLTEPEQEGAAPGVVLVTGSGPQDRDETVAGHKPFLVLADALTRHGIAVLRYDDRGVGASTGDFATATTADFAADAEAAIRFLRSRDEVASDKVGVLGHSEGALVAAILASHEDGPAFAVLLAPPGVPGDEILLSQARRAMEISGGSEQAIDANVAARRALFATVKSGASDAEIRASLEKHAAAVFGQADPPPAMVATVLAQLTSPWMRYFMSYDPATALAHAKVPELALFGGKDTQVIPELNAPAVKEALAKSGQDVTVEVLPGLNHLFQGSKTGAVAEYRNIEQTMSPKVLDRIATWIIGHMRSRSAG